MRMFLAQENPHKTVDTYAYTLHMMMKFEVWIATLLSDRKTLVVDCPHDGYYHPVYTCCLSYNLVPQIIIAEPHKLDRTKYGDMV